jgi:acetolactate synthase-1/2/3 large subunit
MSRISDRRARLQQRRLELEAQWEREAQAAGKRNPIHPRWAAYQLAQLMDEDAILLDDAVSNGGYLDPYHKRTKPGTFFSSGGSGGGWGSGAAFGAKMAAPDRDVFLAAGDGFFIFGEPVSALWSAAHEKAPFLSMVFTNRSYSTGTNGLRRMFPEGTAVENGIYDGGVFDPPPDFAKLAEAMGGYGETVREPGRGRAGATPRPRPGAQGLPRGHLRLAPNACGRDDVEQIETVGSARCPGSTPPLSATVGCVPIPERRPWR